jgi:hypothetical protein
MTALGVKEDKATIVNHGTSDTTFALTPNVLHTWGTVNSLTLTLASGSSTYVDGYWFKFTASSSFTALTMPSGINWVTEPEIEAGKTYEVMIVDGLASYLSDGIDSGYATQEWVQSHTQAPLVSGTNIKTINNESLLGSGNITISGGGGGSGEANVIESISINGTTQTVTSKNVDLAVPTSSTITAIVTLTEAQYTALSTKDSSTLYIITA